MTDNERIQRLNRWKRGELALNTIEIREGAKLLISLLNAITKQLEQRDKTMAELQYKLDNPFLLHAECGKRIYALEQERDMCYESNTLMLSAINAAWMQAAEYSMHEDDCYHTIAETLEEAIVAVKALTVSKQGLTSAAEPASEQTNK